MYLYEKVTSEVLIAPAEAEARLCHALYFTT